MKKNQTYKNLNYDFSDYAEEITGNALFEINGGAEIENSIEAQANAKVGDTVTNSKGETHVLTQGDITWAQDIMDEREKNHSGNTNNSNNQNSSITPNTNSQSNTQSNTRTNTNKEKQSFGIIYDPNDYSRVIVDLDNPKAMQQAADLLAEPSLEIRVTAYGSKSCVVKNFNNYGEIYSYLESIRPKTDGGITVMDVVGGISTSTGFLNIWLENLTKQPLENITVSELKNYTKATSFISNITGFTSAINNAFECYKEPTFKNIMNATSDLLGFIPGIGPSISIVSNTTAEVLNDGVNAGLDIYAPFLIKEQTFNSVVKMNSNTSNGYILNNIDIKALLYSGFRTFFGDERK